MRSCSATGVHGISIGGSVQMRCQHWVAVGLSLLLTWAKGVDAHSIVFPAAAPSDHPATQAKKVLPAAASAHGVSTKRAIKDLSDDLPGYQIHVMYVIPSDGADKKLDVN